MDLKTQMREIMQQIDQVTELFYQQKEQEGYGALNALLADLVASIDVLYQYKQQHEEISFDEQEFQAALVDAMNALEEKDAVLLADILKYDIYEKFEAVVEQL